MTDCQRTVHEAALRVFESALGTSGEMAVVEAAAEHVVAAGVSAPYSVGPIPSWHLASYHHPYLRKP